MTKQEYYDLLVRAAKDGTFPSIEGNHCKYRSADGRKCPIGILILDADYEPRWDVENGYGIAKLPHNLLQAIIPEGMTVIDLGYVQECHDQFRNFPWSPEQFIKDLNPLFTDCAVLWP